ncbi:hypothetical protein ACFDR9_002108 [Janthinobacterium sp. CG_23.3]|uniref:DUF3108 domain-containing protein n=1 Tax=Janthinobacterium sp. CG_23.3 TaxID=3349634 RepID=UPI0038D3A934
MSITTLQRTLAAALLAAALAPAAAADQHPSVKRAFSVPPSADLSYSIKARQRGLGLAGDSTTAWRAGDGKYSVASETRSALFGKILENKSDGAIDDYGLAPSQYYEKRYRKEPGTATFKRDSKTIVFGGSEQSYPLKGGEQDRNSAPWQLVAVARGAPDKFTPGSEWAFFVAGRRDAEAWVFKVLNQESVHTGEGEVSAVHLVKAPPPNDQGQQVEVWLAPSLDWFPVKLRFSDNDGDYVEQTLEKITKK